MLQVNQGTYPGSAAMTWADVRAIDALNRKNGYGISYRELKGLCTRHQRARESGDVRTMEKIEYRLTDINFHHECGMMARGEYAELREELNRH